MVAPPAKALRSSDALTEELAAAIMRETGVKLTFALVFVVPIVRHLQTEYGGGKIYISKPGRTYRAADIRAEFARTRDVKATCKKFGISRRTLYRHLDIEDDGTA